MNDKTEVLVEPSYYNYIEARQILFHYHYHLELKQICENYQLLNSGQNQVLAVIESQLFEWQKHCISEEETYDIMQILSGHRKDFDSEYQIIIDDIQGELQQLAEIHQFCKTDNKQVSSMQQRSVI